MLPSAPAEAAAAAAQRYLCSEWVSKSRRGVLGVERFLSEKETFGAPKSLVLPRKLFVGPKVFFRSRWITIWQTASISTMWKIWTSELFWLLLRGFLTVSGYHVVQCDGQLACGVAVGDEKAVGNGIWHNHRWIRTRPWLSSQLLPSVCGRQSSQQGHEIVRSHQQCLRFCPVPHERSGGPCHSPS